jgi:hypothetical protein
MEQMSGVSQVLAKSLVAFKLTGDEAASAINSFHSAVLGTPLSLQGLSNALGNSAAAFATLIEFTNKSGQELNTYKTDLLDLNVAMTGQLAKLGLQASQSGTVIRLVCYTKDFFTRNRVA